MEGSETSSPGIEKDDVDSATDPPYESESDSKQTDADPSEIKLLSKPKRRKRKKFEVSDADFLPSFARKTAKGGYAHTNRSKSLISKANMGNTPWNKGRTRSSADRAKIAAGVRARNRAILLEKLKRLGMSEEEYMQKKREIKYLRERIRRSKAANAKHKAVEAELKLQAAIDATTEKKPPVAAAPGDKEAKPEDVSNKAEESAPKTEEGKQVFAKDIIWTPYKFGEENEDYSEVCPDDGPGGLICCSFCAKKYTWYLSKTVKDIEVQRTHKVGNDAKEILEFLGQGRKTLDRALGVAKKKLPPLPSSLPNAEAANKQQAKRSSNSEARFNLTSTLDISDAPIEAV